MKKISFLLISFCACFTVFCQQPNNKTTPGQGFNCHSFPFQDSISKLFATKLNLSQPVQQATFSHVLANGDKIYLLPRDNMPCAVPDMSKYNYNMPVERGKIEGTMPNASPAMPLIPKQEQ
jgi:hypothetical protein